MWEATCLHFSIYIVSNSEEYGILCIQQELFINMSEYMYM